MNSIILTMGLNHTTAPIHVREQIARAPCIRDDALDDLQGHLSPPAFSEALVLSTCNRTEVYAVVPDRSSGEAALRQLFTDHETFAASAADYLYTFADQDAAEHLFAVACGIDSMIVGESEILGQVREAYLAAASHRSLGPILHQLLKDAIHVGKRAHSETAIGAGAASVAYAAVAIAREHLGPLAGRQALVIGAGEMGRRAAGNLADDGACTVVVANRTFERATQLAHELGGDAVHFDDLPGALAKADLVISATAAPHIILSSSVVREVMEARRGRPLCLVDIAVPRDIDPEAAQIPGVRLFNIDDLQQLVDGNRAAREQAVAEVRVLIAEQVRSFWQWFLGRTAAPALADLQARAEAIRRAELDKALRKLGHLHLSERDRNVIAALSAGIIHKMLAAPTVHLKDRLQDGDGQLYLEVVRELFELPDPDGRVPPPAGSDK